MTPPPIPLQRVATLSAYATSHLLDGVILLALVGVVLGALALLMHAPGDWKLSARAARGLVSPQVWGEAAKWATWVPKVYTRKDLCPTVRGGWATPAGVTLMVHMQRGLHWEALSRDSKMLASAMRCRSVSVRPVPHNAGRALVQVIRADAFRRPRRWPLLDARTIPPFAEGTPLGNLAEGTPKTLRLLWRNLLVGGIMGSGKTVAMCLVVAHALLSGDTDVWILDGKSGIGFGAWRRVAAGFATETDDPRAVLGIMGHLTHELERRLAWLAAHSLDKIPLDGTFRLHLVVIDEYTEFLRIPGFEKWLTEFSRRARAAGMVVMLGTQRPSSKTISTDLRAIIAFGLALTCTEPASSDMILRPGLASLGYDASKFEDDRPGEAYLLAETAKTPDHIRCYNFTDADRRAVLARVEAMRAKDSHVANGSAPNDRPAPPNGPRPAPLPVRSVVPDGPPANVPELPAPPKGPPLHRADGTRSGRGAVLAALAAHPAQTYDQLATTTGLSGKIVARYCADLEGAAWARRARLVTGAKRAGARDPWVWSITDEGRRALSKEA